MNYVANGRTQSMHGLENESQEPDRPAYEVMVVSCIVKTDDTSKESIELSSKLGLRLRKILSDQSVTASSFARSFIEKNKICIRAVCDEQSGDSNCNITMTYGTGTSTNIMIRYDEKAGKPIFVGSLLMQIKIAENGMTSLVLPRDNLYMQVQSCASFPPEVYIAPSKNSSSWEDGDGTDDEEEVKETTTILLNVNDENEIYSVQVDPSNPVIKAFKKSDSTTTKKKAARTVKVSSSEDEEVAASVPVKSKRKADTEKVGEKVTKKTKVAGKKQPEKAIVESSEAKAPKIVRTRSRSASIVEEKDTTPASKVAAGSKKTRKDSNASEDPKSSKKKKTKKVKDPDAPKRPLTSFMLFCKDAREDLKKEHPEAAVPEMGKLLGAKFKELSAAEKGVYESQAAALKTQFDLDKAGYLKSKVDEEALAEKEEIESVDTAEPKSKSSSKKRKKTIAPAEEEKEEIESVDTAELKAKSSSKKDKKTITPAQEDETESVDSVEPETKASSKKKKTKKVATTKESKEKGDTIKKTQEATSTEETEDSKESPKKKKTKKKSKDPDAPKRPLASYMLFCKALRPKVVEENPNAKVPEIGQKLGKLWKKLTPEESAKYQKDADKLKGQYRKDMEIYEKNKVDDEGDSDGGDKDEEEEAPKTAKKKKKSKKDPLAPKRAQSAYMFFCSSKRPELKEEQPKLTVPETGKILGKMWHDVSTPEKAPFDEMAMKDKERYKSEMETFKTSS